MAKKKVSNNPNQQSNEVVETKPTDNSINSNNSNDEKLERLKSLNTLLVKEAVERRHLVDSLIQEKGSLESVLTRTNSVKEEMVSELTQLSEDALRLEIERSVVFDFIGVRVGEYSEGVVREMERMEVGRGEVEGLKEEMKEVLEEKREIEKARIEKEEEVLVLEEKVKGLLSEIGLEKGVYVEVERERDELEVQLGLQVKETEELRLELIEVEGKLKGVEEEMEKLGVKYDSVVEENEERKNEIEKLTRDKASFERDAVKVIGEMEGKIAIIEKEKEGIEEEMGLEKQKNVELETTVSRLNETVLKMGKVEEKLRMDMAELEKKCIEGEEMQMEMATKIDQLVLEKVEMSKALEGVVEEKILVEKNLDDAMKQLSDQMREAEIVQNEKTEVLEVLSGKESEIVELERVVSELREVVEQLKISCNEGITKINDLQSEVASYKDALDLATAARDADRIVIDVEKNKGLELLQQTEDMSKIIEDKAKLVEEMKAENAVFSGEKGSLEKLCEKLRNDLALAESSLAEVRKEFDRFRSTVELEKEGSERVLNLLKGTVAELVSSMDDVKVVTDRSKQSNGGGSESYVSEFETIKKAFKRKEMTGEEMKREIEVLKNSVAEEHKKKSFWTFMSSATTILATISLAYIARGH